MAFKVYLKGGDIVDITSDNCTLISLSSFNINRLYFHGSDIIPEKTDGIEKLSNYDAVFNFTEVRGVVKI